MGLEAELNSELCDFYHLHLLTTAKVIISKRRHRLVDICNHAWYSQFAIECLRRSNQQGLGTLGQNMGMKRLPM